MKEHAKVPKDSLVTEYSLVWMIKLYIVGSRSSFSKVKSYAIVFRESGGGMRGGGAG